MTNEELELVRNEYEAQYWRNQATPHLILPQAEISKREAKRIAKEFRNNNAMPIILPPGAQIDSLNRRADELLKQCEETDRYIEALLQHDMITGRQAKKALPIAVPEPEVEDECAKLWEEEIHTWGEEEPVIRLPEENFYGKKYYYDATGEWMTPLETEVTKTIEENTDALNQYYGKLKEAARNMKLGDAYLDRGLSHSATLHYNRASKLYSEIAPPSRWLIFRLGLKQGAEVIRNNLLRLRRFVIPGQR